MLIRKPLSAKFGIVAYNSKTMCVFYLAGPSIANAAFMKLLLQHEVIRKITLFPVAFPFIPC